MYNKIKELNEMVKTLNNLKNVGEVNNDPKSVFESLGINKDEFESKFSEALKFKSTLKFTKLSENAVSPKYAYLSDSGFDLHSTEDVVLEPFGRGLVPTGLSFDIPEGFEIQVRSKSGLCLKQGLMVLNSPGTVDRGYTGEVKVIIMNMNNNAVTIPSGQKIAQAVLCPVMDGTRVDLHESIEINEKERSDKGFGSTGI
jgi:dUTP pyrophosphatase